MVKIVIIQINVIMGIVVLNITIRFINNTNKYVWINIKFKVLKNIIILLLVFQEELCYNIKITIRMAQLQLHQSIHNINNTITV